MSVIWGLYEINLTPICTNPRNKDRRQDHGLCQWRVKRSWEKSTTNTTFVGCVVLWAKRSQEAKLSLLSSLCKVLVPQSTLSLVLVFIVPLSLVSLLVTLLWLKLQSFDRANHGPMLVIMTWRPVISSSLPIPRRWSFFARPWLCLLF